MSQPIRTLAVIGNQAFSLVNFRGPLLRDLLDRGVSVYALAPDYDARSWAAVEAVGAMPVELSLSRVGMNPLRDSRDFLRLCVLLRELSPDASLAYFIKPVIYGSIAARLAGVPRVFSLIEGVGFPFGPPAGAGVPERVLRPVVERLYRLALRDAEAVFMLNSDDEALFLRTGLVTPDKVVRLPGIGVDLERFQAVPPPLRPLTFLLAARLLWEKGVREFVAAARHVKRRHPEVRFILLGDVDPNPRSIGREEVLAWVEERVIEWPGWVDDVRPWLARASVFVLPSYREGVPRSTQEAMAMARPIITTDAPGCRDTVREGENGFLVPVRDEKALAEAMLRFVYRPQLIPEMGGASRRLAEARFDVSRVNGIILGAMGL